MQVKTKNLIVGLLAVALVGLLWYRTVYAPMESKASKDRAAAHDADLSAQNLRQAITGSTGSKKNTKKNDVATDVMLAAIPVDPAEAAFLRSVDALRVSSGADWQSITPTAPTVIGTVGTINIGITVQGSEDQLARYLAGLADIKRIFVTDNVSITSAATGSGPGAPAAAPPGAVFTGGELQMQIAGRVFTQPGAVASATTGAAGAVAGQTPAAKTPAAGGSAPPGVQNN